MSCNANGIFKWHGGSKQNYKVIWEIMRKWKALDEWVGGIWASRIPKMSMMPLCLRWRKLPTANRLLQEGAAMNPKCSLCDEAESIPHLFYRCTYTHWVLKEAMEIAGFSLLNPQFCY